MNIAIIGAGLTGLTWARCFADANQLVTVFEGENYLGGNCFDYFDKSTNVYVHNHGPHIFHTNKENVWNFINRFSRFNNYIHKALARTSMGEFFVPLSVNCTMNENEIIELFFKSYSIKQWGKPWDKLPEFVRSRVPRKRDIESNQYFLDKYQGIPIDGYNMMFKKMVDHNNIKIVFNSFIDYQFLFFSSFDIIIVTDSIDRFFNYCFGKLPYRSARFVHYKSPGTQWRYVINDCTLNNSYTRIWDNRTWLNGINSESETIVSEEYPIEYQINKSMARTHPILEQENICLYQKYLDYSKLYSNKFIFSGRLGTYKYIDMDEAIHSVLTKFNEIKECYIKK
jgi:UDP-galactopyranose mutase